jgi:hypothetical protein
MTHTIEPAKSGRAKCRGCGRAIGKGELRFGERLPNPFGDDDMTLWFHLRCGAYKRPEPMLEVLPGADIEEREQLEAIAKHGLQHRRIPRINGVERAPSGRARCRGCRKTIERDTWRIPLVFYQEGMFNPSGFLHLSCAASYFETTDVVERMLHFAGDLAEDDIADIRRRLAGADS